jgi:signal transduction histidine kinase
MNKIVKKANSKLGLLFLLFVFLPGAILAYLSIQTIANQKELTEKRLIEDQNDLSKELTESFQSQLLECVTRFFRDVNLPSIQSQNISSFDSVGYVEQAFVMAKDGQLIWPNYVQSVKLTGAKSERFLKAIARAEKLEFAESNLANAMSAYNEALAIAVNQTERALAVNGLARVLTKSGLWAQARVQYEILANDYGSTIDDTGVPFAHYAVHQLLHIMSDANTTLKEVEIILQRLSNGEIVLTDHTESLLQEVSLWLEEQKGASIEDVNSMMEKISLIRKLLTFVNQEGRTLFEYASNNLYNCQKLGSFDAIAYSLNGQPNLLVVHRDDVHSQIIGFKVRLGYLKNKVLATAYPSTSLFDFQVQIATRADAARLSNNPLSTIKELNTFVPDWRICITLQNPRLIEKFITQRRWIYGITLTFLVAGMFLGIALVLRDVSRERRLAQLRSDFVSNVTHELKTPLTSIRMFAETVLLGRIRSKEEKKEYLEIIVNESERLTRLINTVLDFSKIERGQKQYQMKSTNITEVAKSALKAMDYTFKEQGFQLNVELEPDIHAIADPDAIEQAILNLLSNALKYSRDRKETAVRLWSQNQSVFFRVKDAGIGISLSEQKHIFEKYYRVPSESRSSGVGLGLTVVKHIVDAHQGIIKVESELGQGSTFTIILPKEIE